MNTNKFSGSLIQIFVHFPQLPLNLPRSGAIPLVSWGPTREVARAGTDVLLALWKAFLCDYRRWETFKRRFSSLCDSHILQMRRTYLHLPTVWWLTGCAEMTIFAMVSPIWGAKSRYLHGIPSGMKVHSSTSETWECIESGLHTSSTWVFWLLISYQYHATTSNPSSQGVKNPYFCPKSIMLSV